MTYYKVVLKILWLRKCDVNSDEGDELDGETHEDFLFLPAASIL
jgi:hypothetical protein